jgi:hypothetical protein
MGGRPLGSGDCHGYLTTMHTNHIGDSLDAAKSVVLKLFDAADINTRLVPLPSHSDFDYDTFTLCVTPQVGDAIFRSNIPYAAHNRGRYLNDLNTWLQPQAHEIDSIIFDPDTGIRPDRDTNKFFGLQRVRQFLERFRNVAIGVYQHRRTGGLSYAQSLKLIPEHACCGYDFGAAALLFWAHADGASKVNRIKSLFQSQLNSRRVIEAVK